LPPRAQEQLNLTADQQTQMSALEADVKAKLEKILTREQLQQLKQMRPPPRQGGPGGRGGPGGPGYERRSDGPWTTQTLTDAQKEQVKVILSKYDANTLTPGQARAIHEAFRQAGLRGGPAMGDAIRAAGFDPGKLRDLAPPPGQDGGRGRPGRSFEGDSAQGDSQGPPQGPTQE
jgi:Spy/CpxP family protein refolding chaperone